MTTLLPAVFLLALNADGKILSVSRKNNLNDFNLPGGKVEPGETLIQALIREVKEETGLNIFDLQLIFEQSDNRYTKYCFLGKVKGKITTSEKGIVKWADIFTLLTGSFLDYNQQVFQHLKLI